MYNWVFLGKQTSSKRILFPTSADVCRAVQSIGIRVNCRWALFLAKVSLIHHQHSCLKIFEEYKNIETYQESCPENISSLLPIEILDIDSSLLNLYVIVMFVSYRENVAALSVSYNKQVGYSYLTNILFTRRDLICMDNLLVLSVIYVNWLNDV